MPDVLGKTIRIARLDGGERYRTFRQIEALHRAQRADEPRREQRSEQGEKAVQRQVGGDERIVLAVGEQGRLAEGERGGEVTLKLWLSDLTHASPPWPRAAAVPPH